MKRIAIATAMVVALGMLTGCGYMNLSSGGQVSEHPPAFVLPEPPVPVTAPTRQWRLHVERQLARLERLTRLVTCVVVVRDQECRRWMDLYVTFDGLKHDLEGIRQ